MNRVKGLWSTSGARNLHRAVFERAFATGAYPAGISAYHWAEVTYSRAVDTLALLGPQVCVEAGEWLEKLAIAADRRAKTERMREAPWMIM